VARPDAADSDNPSGFAAWPTTAGPPNGLFHGAGKLPRASVISSDSPVLREMFSWRPSIAHSETTVPPSEFDDLKPASDRVSQAKSRVADIGQRAAETLDEKRDAVARGMESAASALHGRAESLPGGQKISSAAHSAAGAMEMAADYVRDHDLRKMLSDLGQVVKRHPGATLLTAAALGFLLARNFSRNR
jgi:hypothetical protein